MIAAIAIAISLAGAAEVLPPNLARIHRVQASEMDRYLAGVRDRIWMVVPYPPEERENGTEGIVHVAFTIHKDGSISGLRILRSSGNRNLDAAALAGIKAAKFRGPPGLDGLNVDIPLRFRGERIGDRRMAN